MVKILGVDEAGRGPVIGPMVIAGVLIEECRESKLGKVKDSKLLPHNKRIELDNQIRSNSRFKIIKVLPQEIDQALTSKDLNLNWLEAHKQAEIIDKLNPDKAIIDCPSPNCRKFKEYLKELLIDKNVELIVEHKADINYSVCSAASIIAKVKREQEVDKIKGKYSDIGSGYPSDPKTKEFLKNNWNRCPEIFRHSWASYKKYSETKEKQETLEGF